MRLAVTEILDQAQAVPAAGEPGWRGLRFDQPNLVDFRLRRHRHRFNSCGPLVGRPVPGRLPLPPRPAYRSQREPAQRDDSGRPTVADTTVDLLVVGSGTGMAAALAAHELRAVGADRGEVVLRRRFDRPLRRRTVAARVSQCCARRAPTTPPRAPPPTSTRWSPGRRPSNAPRLPDARVRDGRHAAPNHSAAAVLGSRLLRLPPGGAGRQRRGPHLRVPPAGHLDARRLPHPAAAGRAGGRRLDTDDRR